MIAAAVYARPAIADPENFWDHATGRAFTRARPADRDLIELFGEDYRFNPRELLTEDDHAIAQLWAMRRSAGGMGGGGALPDPGGLLDQPALLMEALQIMDGALAEIEAEERDEAAKARGKK